MKDSASNIRVRATIIRRLYKLRSPEVNSYNKVVTFLLDFYDKNKGGKNK